MTKIQKLRGEKAATQGHRCYYCDHPTWTGNITEFAARHAMSIREARRFRQTAEHLVPQVDGGKDTLSNIVMACAYCNCTRHRGSKALQPKAYKKKVMARLKGGRWHGRLARTGRFD